MIIYIYLQQDKQHTCRPARLARLFYFAEWFFLQDQTFVTPLFKGKSRSRRASLSFLRIL